MILAIDPGPTESAYVLWDGSRILEMSKATNSAILMTVRPARLDDLDLVIEQVTSFGMPVGIEVFETVFWSGRFAEAFSEAFRREAHRLPRLKVKQHLCHDSRAKDSNIRQALIDRFGGPSSIKRGGMLYKVSGDIWSALALAVTYWDTEAHNGKP